MSLLVVRRGDEGLSAEECGACLCSARLWLIKHFFLAFCDYSAGSDLFTTDFERKLQGNAPFIFRHHVFFWTELLPSQDRIIEPIKAHFACFRGLSLGEILSTQELNFEV